MNNNTRGRISSFFAGILVKHRNLFFWGMLALIISGLYFALSIGIDNSLEQWFLEKDETLIAYREFKQQYGNDEILLALIDCRDEGMFSQAMLNRIYEASIEIENDTYNFRRVLSVGVAPYIGLKGDELIVEDLMLSKVSSEQEAEKIRERFFDDPFKKRVLQSDQSHYAIIIAEPVATDDMDVRRPEIIAAFQEKLQGFDYKLAGMGVMYDELNRLSMQDGGIFNAAAYVIISLLIYLLYKSKTFLAMVVLAMLLSGASFLGFYGFFDQHFNMVTIVLPTLIMILSVADVAYVYNNFCYNSKYIKNNKEEGLKKVFSEVLPPCFFTSLTNAFGFSALTVSSLSVLRVFGLFAAFAALAEFFVSMTVAVFMLGRLELKDTVTMKRPFASFVSRWMDIMPRYAKYIVFYFIITSFLAITGVSILNIDTYSMGFLSETNQVRKESDYIEANYGNYLPLEIKLMTGKRDGIKTVDFMTRLDKTHSSLEKHPEIEKTASILDVLKKLNQVMSDGSWETYRVPEADFAISQLIMLYESDPDNDLEFMTDPPRYTQVRLTARVPMVSAAGLKDYEKIVNNIVTEHFQDSDVTWQFGGYVPLYARIINYVTWSQLSSFALAFVLVFGAVIVLFKKLRAFLLVVAPNLYPVFMTMGLMGLTGINLDIATVTIAAVTMGIVVDDTIHALYLFYDPQRSHMTPVEAAIDSLKEAGPAIMATSVIYSLGFLFMLFASIKSISFFGLLLSFTIVMALVAELTILPAQICYLEKFLAPDFNKKTNSKDDDDNGSDDGGDCNESDQDSETILNNDNTQESINDDDNENEDIDDDKEKN